MSFSGPAKLREYLLEAAGDAEMSWRQSVSGVWRNRALPLLPQPDTFRNMNNIDFQVSPVAAGVGGRCPRCGRGRLFQMFLNMRDRCSSCGLDYKFVDTGDGPAVFAIFILGFGVLGAALWVEFTYAPALWVHALLWGAVTPILALGLLRLLKGLLIGLQYRNKAEEGQIEDNG